MCKGIHNFWGKDRLSEILCFLFLRDLCASVRDSCVRGSHPIFGPPTDNIHIVCSVWQSVLEYYHYRKRSLRRAFKSLTCVFYRVHGKEALCRAPNKTHGKESLPCVLISDTRQRIFAARFNFWRTAKIFFLPPLLQKTTVSVCRAF
jgi:hypothetical protein